MSTLYLSFSSTIGVIHVYERFQENNDQLSRRSQSVIKDVGLYVKGAIYAPYEPFSWTKFWGCSSRLISGMYNMAIAIQRISNEVQFT